MKTVRIFWFIILLMFILSCKRNKECPAFNSADMQHIVYQEFDSKKVLSAMLLCLSIYFLFSTTIHPWYITTLVFLSIFTRFNFPIVWSFTVIFSYSAYSNLVFEEKPIWLFVEYLPIFLLIYLEVFKQTRENTWQPVSGYKL